MDALSGVDYVFHAAALKQVPSCEFYPMEAVKTNVIGAENVIRAAMAQGVARGRAVHRQGGVPDQRHGAVQGHDGKGDGGQERASCDPPKTVMSATRYGNVMASRGSVIPLFLQQLLEGKPLTLTDPTMTRFLMSLEESVDLVLYAFEHARPGDIFVQKAPASTVGDLAEAMRQLFKKMQRDQGHRHAPWREALRERWSRARRWHAPRTWAATTASRPIRAT